MKPAKLLIKAENQNKPIKREVKKDSVELELEKLHGLEIKQEKADFISDGIFNCIKIVFIIKLI